MKCTRKLVSLLLILSLFFPTFATCEGSSDWAYMESELQTMFDYGLSMSDIIEVLNPYLEEAFKETGPNTAALFAAYFSNEAKNSSVRVFDSVSTPDLSSLSYSELISLKDKINLAIWQSDEWQEVTVPQGVWVVGEDIPAGHWTVKCANGWYTQVSWGERLSDSGESIRWSGRYSVMNSVYNPNSSLYDVGDRTEYSFEVRVGDYIVIDTNNAVFTPYAGKPDLGFK